MTTQAKLSAIVRRLNERPRKSLLYPARWRITTKLETNRGPYAAGTASLVSTTAASDSIQSSKQRRRSGFSRYGCVARK